MAPGWRWLTRGSSAGLLAGTLSFATGTFLLESTFFREWPLGFRRRKQRLINAWVPRSQNVTSLQLAIAVIGPHQIQEES